MVDVKDLHPQYVTDENGEKKSVILSLAAFEELLEDIEDLATVAERREEPTLTHEEVIAGLKRNGLL